MRNQNNVNNQERSTGNSSVPGNSKNGGNNRGRYYNNKKKKSKKNNSTSKPTGADTDNVELDSTGRDNDPTWYFESAELAEQSTHLSFQNFVGFGNLLDDYQLPTVVTYGMNPSVGISYGVTKNGVYEYMEGDAGSDNLPDAAGLLTNKASGINLMANRIYTELSMKSGRNMQYQPNDVAIMLGAIGAFCEISEYIRRAFGVVLTQNARNRYVPIGLLESMGIDHVTLLANVSDYRMRFNTTIARINQVPLLDNVGFIRKCRDIFQYLYADSDSAMAQLYIYVPSSTWVLDEESDPNGSRLVTRECVFKVDGSSSVPVIRDMEYYLDLLDEMAYKLLTSSTMNKVYADLLNLARYKTLAFWKFDFLAENYAVMPLINRNSLLQMHNATIIGMPARFASQGNQQTDPEVDGFKFTYSNDVVSDASTGTIIYNPAFESIKKAALDQLAVDVDTDSPSLEDRIEMLRYCVIPGYYSVSHIMMGGQKRYARAFPTIADHYLTHVFIARNLDWSSSTPSLTGNGRSSNIIVDWNGSGSALALLCGLTQVHWSPLLYGVRDPQEHTPAQVQYMFGELDYCTAITYDYMARLNRIVATGLFALRG